MLNDKQEKSGKFSKDGVGDGIDRQEFYRLLEKACQPIKDDKSDSGKS